MKRTIAMAVSTTVAALALVVLSEPAPVSATAAVTHEATGSGGDGYTPTGYCVNWPLNCTYGSSLSIQASDRPGAYGYATYTQYPPLASVEIAFSCVVISHLTTGGHVLYASGQGSGTGAGKYFVKLVVDPTSGGRPSYEVSRIDSVTDGQGEQPTRLLPCGGVDSTRHYAKWGAFRITPVE